MSEIGKMISNMTVEQKAGQLTQIDLGVILKNGFTGDLDQKKIKEAINKYYVGSIINTGYCAFPLSVWNEIISQILIRSNANNPRIPVLYGIDAIHGVTYTLNSTLFPHSIGVAAARNTELAKHIATVTAVELRASGIRWNFHPVLDAGRMPLWSRFPETFGEDSYLISEMGKAFVHGYQQESLSDPTSVAACLKHFVGYSNPRTGRDRTPSFIPELELREHYLPQFKAAIDAGAASVMVNSGSLNRVPVHASKYLLTHVLKNELGFEGVVVSDWEDVYRLHERHHVCDSIKSAVKTALLAGIDICMTPHDFRFTEALIELLNDPNEIELKERVDEAIRKVLQLKFSLNLFEEADKQENIAFGEIDFMKLAYKAACESMTLLENKKQTLPIPESSKVLIVGPSANNLTSLHGSWSYTWQGNHEKMYWKDEKRKTNSIDLFPDTTRSIKEAFEERLGNDFVKCFSDRDYNKSINFSADKLKRESNDVDYIVLCIGEDACAESPGSIQDLTIEDRQQKLLNAAISTKKKVVVVLLEGRPRILGDLIEKVDAVIMAYQPGSQGANAIADLILGKYSPAGKLPFTYPRKSGDFVLYDHVWTERNVEILPGKYADTGYNPQWTFGHGLSYTQFKYEHFEMSSHFLLGNGEIIVSVDISNCGQMDGTETIEVYLRDVYASITPPLKRLKKFRKIFLAVGESKKVNFSITSHDLSFIKPSGSKFDEVVEEGSFEVVIGAMGLEMDSEKQNYVHGKLFTYKN